MFVGHGLVAFALAAGGARLAGWSPERALSLGLLAGAFGLAPDVDILYAPVGVLGANGPFEAADGFWSAGNRVHRAVTHSLVVGGVAALAAGALALDHRLRAGRAGQVAGVLALVALVAVAAAFTGALAAIVMAAFAGAVVVLALAGRRRLSLGAPAVAVAAGVGLLTHPFGDLFTGEPPVLLYPVDATVLAERVALATDPTLHLLGALFVELSTAWLAVAVLYWVRSGERSPLAWLGASRSRRSGPEPAGRRLGWVGRGRRRLRRTVDARAGLAVGYAGVAALLPAPTLAVSYHFVLPLLLVGVAVGLVTMIDPDPRVPRAERAAVSGLTAVSLAAGAYALGYLLVA